MAQRRHHYERAFEAYLRTTRTPYISVDEAKRALLPPKPDLSVEVGTGASAETESLKSFDFVMYTGSTEPGRTPSPHLLVEIKGRRIGRKGDRVLTTKGRLESWVTQDDVTALDRWQQLFNGSTAATSAEPMFAAAFVFVYWCAIQPPDALFQDVFSFGDRWYALRMIELDLFRDHLRTRSEKWGTVQMERSAFERLSRPLSVGTRRPLDAAKTLPDRSVLGQEIEAARRDRLDRRAAALTPKVELSTPQDSVVAPRGGTRYDHP